MDPDETALGCLHWVIYSQLDYIYVAILCDPQLLIWHEGCDSGRHHENTPI